MRRTITGWFLAVTGFLACPCHLVITLPLAAALLSGTALGGWITTHQGAIVVGASIYFVGALAAGVTLTQGRSPLPPGSSGRAPATTRGPLSGRSAARRLVITGGFPLADHAAA